MKKSRSFSLIFLVIILTASCKVLQPDRIPDLTPGESLYRESGTGDTSDIANIPWRKLFTDPRLQNLIDSAVKNNPDMQVAIARMKRAEAVFRQSRASFFPSLDAGFNASFQSKNVNIGLPELYQLYGSSSWEADIWGRLRSTKRANKAAFLASEASARAVMTQLVSSVAMNYYALLALDAQLDITQQTVQKRISNVETMKALKQSDVVTGADLVLSEANRYSAEVTIPDLKQNIYELENSLMLLTGREPGPVERGRLDEQDLAPELKTGVPAQLLANRPDVQEAEYTLRSSFYMIKAARASFYPSLTITGRTGISQTDISKLFSSPLFFWNIAGGLLQPIFNNGLNLERLRVSRTVFNENLALYRKTLLGAGEEVANAMHAYQSANEKISIRAQQLDYLQKSVDYTMELLKYTSNTSYIDVLTSEVNLLSAQLASVNDRLQQLQSVVTLYRSLGGGWK